MVEEAGNQLPDTREAEDWPVSDKTSASGFAFEDRISPVVIDLRISICLSPFPKVLSLKVQRGHLLGSSTLGIHS